MATQQHRRSPGLSGLSAAVLALLLCCCSTTALAVTLGNEQILSWLGDPVEVEIGVQDWQELDFSQVQISVAGPEDYDSFRLTWLPVLEDLHFNLIGPNLDGEVKVLVSTREPVSEPYIELLLVMRWPAGSLLREYVLLFDLPPDDAAAGDRPVVEQAEPASIPSAGQDGTAQAEAAGDLAQQVPVRTASGTVEATAEGTEGEAQVAESGSPAIAPPPLNPGSDSEAPPAASLSAPEDSAAQLAETVEQAPAVTAEQLPDVRSLPAIAVQQVAPQTGPQGRPAGNRRSYRVREGDILWNIAQQFLPAGSGSGIYQMLLSLHALNRPAFINGNISMLKAGADLQIPGEEDIAAVDPDSARRLFEQGWEDATRRVELARSGGGTQDFSPLSGDASAADPVQAPVESEPEPAVAADRERPAPSAELRTVAQAGEIEAPAELAATPPAEPLPPALQDSSAGAEPSAEVASDAAAADAGNPSAAAAAGSLPETAAPIPAETVVSADGSVAEQADGNPYIQRITESAQDMQGLLRSRTLQIAALEQQIVEMRIRMREAGELASALADSLEAELQERRSRNQRYRANTMLLALVSLACLLALALAIALVLQLIARLRRQRLRLEALLAANAAAAAPVYAAGTEPGMANRDTSAAGAGSGDAGTQEALQEHALRPSAADESGAWPELDEGDFAADDSFAQRDGDEAADWRREP